jgi:hypothetical protein
MPPPRISYNEGYSFLQKKIQSKKQNQMSVLLEFINKKDKIREYDLIFKRKGKKINESNDFLGELEVLDE